MCTTVLSDQMVALLKEHISSTLTDICRVTAYALPLPSQRWWLIAHSIECSLAMLQEHPSGGAKSQDCILQFLGLTYCPSTVGINIGWPGIIVKRRPLARTENCFRKVLKSDESDANHTDNPKIVEHMRAKHE